MTLYEALLPQLIVKNKGKKIEPQNRGIWVLKKQSVLVLFLQGLSSPNLGPQQ